MRRFTCTGVYSGSGPPVQWLGSGYYPNGAHEDYQGGLGREGHSSLYYWKSHHAPDLNITLKLGQIVIYYQGYS